MKIETQVLVIGGGVTGAGILRDLTLRGIQAVLVERKDINAGSSGANHGLLHSGGRYIVTDPDSARECVVENAILKRMASGCIEDTGGLFVALEEDDDNYIADFESAAQNIGLPVKQADIKQVLHDEPFLNPNIKAVLKVPDASINPFMTTLANLSAAQQRGAQVLLNTQITSMLVDNRRIVKVIGICTQNGETVEIHPQQVVSAAGPWVDQIGAMVGANLEIAYSKGSLLISNSRLVKKVINRLRPPSDGDIVVPGETVTITGTTSIRVTNPDRLNIPAAEVDLLIREASRTVPVFASTRFIRAYAGVRPLIKTKKTKEDRSLSRTFTVFDHEQDSLENLATVAGGKLTTYRLMAEKTTDLVASRLGVNTICSTHEVPLPGSEQGELLDTSKRLERLNATPPNGEVICECEMVGSSQIDSVLEDLKKNNHKIDPNSIRLRTRLGMGSCQGGFCSFRTIGLLYEKGLIFGEQGNSLLTDFLEKRWPGIKPMLWGEQLRQEQLLEAIYCGSFNIDGNL